MGKTITLTDKGFKVIEIKGSDTLKLGGMAICDMCNNGIGYGYFIAVLNYSVCKDCFAGWHDEATYYNEDTAYEENTVNIAINKLNK